MEERTRFETKKSLGQHFLTSPVVPSWMCSAAEVSAGDVVLEIGPGTGVLTKEILLRGAHVIALEADIRAIEVLKNTFAAEIQNGTLTLHHLDVRGLKPKDIEGLQDHEFKVVANIPYYLSGMLFRTFLESGLQPKSLVYLVQKEVAKRITTDLKRKEKESILSLSVKAYGTPEYVKTVSRGHFSPSPKVDSAIIAVRNITRDNFKELDESLFFALLHIGFGQKRKQLIGNLSKHYDRSSLTHTFSTLSLPVSIRAEDVPLEIWLKLATALQAYGSSQDIPSV
jgi:16S rRNA (adenine1518-N6/adenine1519-N6)-dimethyltransferase